MHNFDGGALTDQSGLQNSESDYRLGQDSEQQILGSNVITSLYNLLDPLELFREGLSRSKDRQTFNSIKPKFPAADYTGESSDQKTLTDNTSERSTETKESNGWSSRHVNQETRWSDENGKGLDARSNSEECPSPDTGSNKGCSPSPDTDSDSSDGDSEECSTIDDNQTVCTSDWGSEEDSSSSLDYFSLLELLEKPHR
ncbi:MAG: hypothetical protein ACR5KX_03540 [Wolbachia sp.]